MKNECCSTCRFWYADGLSDVPSMSTEDDPRWEAICRRFPPTLNRPDPNERDMWELFSQPWVLDCHWCGEWKPVEEESFEPFTVVR